MFIKKQKKNNESQYLQEISFNYYWCLCLRHIWLRFLIEWLMGDSSHVLVTLCRKTTHHKQTDMNRQSPMFFIFLLKIDIWMNFLEKQLDSNELMWFSVMFICYLFHFIKEASSAVHILNKIDKIVWVDCTFWWFQKGWIKDFRALNVMGPTRDNPVPDP